MTAIEWTDETWNPVTGCSKVSVGCDHCYAETVHKTRLDGRHGYPTFKPWTPENAAHNVTLRPDRLNEPLTWRKPRLVFVNSMSDLFHELIPTDYIEQVFVTMARARQHTFQILTKRPDLAAKFLSDSGSRNFIVNTATAAATEAARAKGWVGPVPDAQPCWPLPNVWLGTSIESWRFSHRADQLRRAPAAVRFISAEPLLDTLYGKRPLDLTDIHWLIVGGESGHGARTMEPVWARELRDACLAQCWCCDAMPDDESPECVEQGRRTAFFFKQWGGRTPKAGGRELDGRQWDEYPALERLA